MKAYEIVSAGGIDALFGSDGIYRRVWPAYRQWYQDGFHPWHRDTRDLLAHWQETQPSAA